MIYLLFCSVFVATLFALRQIYQLQITEYRFDRFFTMLKDSGIGGLFMPKILLPAKTIRNLTILVIASCILIVLNYVFFINFKENIILIWLAIFLNYFVSKALVLFVSGFFNPFAKIVRERTIKEAAEIVHNFEVEMIGVTGSFGKSSVKELIYQVLSEKYKVERTSGNHNTDIGVALDIQDKLTKDLDFFVCEMGAYKIGEIGKICGFVKPKYGVLSGIGNQHMDLFGSQENLIQAKSELLKALPEDGIAIVNIDSGYKEKLLEDVKAKVITYGWDEKADYRVMSLKYKKRILFVEFLAFNKSYKFTSALLGDHQAVNLLGIIALALELKMSYEMVQNVIAKIEPLLDKLSLHTGLNGATILNDSYNSNLHGFLSAINVASHFESDKRYAFTYGIFELGAERENAYREIVDAALAGNVTLLTLDKRFSKFGGSNILYMKSENEVMQFLSKNLKERDLLLLEGRCTAKFLEFLQIKRYESND